MTQQAQGSKGQLNMCFESAYGTTPETPSGILLPIHTSEIKSTRGLNESKVIRNNKNPAMPSTGNIDVAGSVKIPLDQIAIGYWLKALLGAPTTTGAGDPYTHTYKPGDQPSMVLEQGFTDIGKYFLYNGCKVDKFSFELGGEGDLEVAIDIKGQKETSGDASFDSTPTLLTLTKYHQFQGSIKEAGVAIATLTKAKFDISCGLDGDSYCIGAQGLRDGLAEDVLQISGSVTALFKDTTLITKAMNTTESSLEFILTASASRTLSFLFPEIFYERSSPGISSPKGIIVELPFKAFYENAAELAAFVVTLKNGVASYA
jgi:hypothetical protein